MLMRRKNERISPTVHSHVDGFADGGPDPVLAGAGVRPLGGFVHRADEQSSVGKLVVG